MALLLDIFGLLSVVLRGFVLTTQSLVLGGIVFLGVVLRPVADELGADGVVSVKRTLRLLRWSALALAAFVLASVALECIALVGTLDIPLGNALGAGFARAGLLAVAAALATALVASGRPSRIRVLALGALGLALLLAQVATSHAAAQVDNRAVLLVADLVHLAAAAAWIGGIPYFLMVLHRTNDGAACALVGGRFSLLLVATVAALIAAGIAMAVPYIGSVEAIYGTAYGVMVATKALLLAGLLMLGAMNNRIVARLRRDPAAPALRLRRFAEVEIAIGLAVIFAAASLTSQPPAVDLAADRASWHEIVERMTPRWPRLESPDHASLALAELQAQIAAAEAAHAPHPQAFVPGEGILPPRNAADVAWSEYNHNVAGLFLIAIGLLALLDVGGARWARHWPLLFVVLAGFLLIKSDPEAWPLGGIGFWASLRDPEVVQHRLFVLLIAAFGVFEWRVRSGRIKSPRAALVFPFLTTVGTALLLTHSHALANIKAQLLMEISHVPVALLGMSAGLARWLELRLDPQGSRIAAWVWPIPFVLVGLILLFYREV